jgi:hypothetical protein
LRELRERRIIEEKEGEDMNIQPLIYKNKKYTVKSIRKEDYSETNPRSREEFAKNIINSLKNAEKYLRGEIKGSKARDFIKQLKEEIAEEETNG